MSGDDQVAKKLAEISKELHRLNQSVQIIVQTLTDYGLGGDEDDADDY